MVVEKEIEISNNTSITEDKNIINLKKNIGCTQKLPTKKREDIIDGNYMNF